MEGLREAVVAAVSGLAGFAAGLLGDLLKRVVPSYSELVAENKALREELRSAEDTLDDERESRSQSPPEQ